MKTSLGMNEKFFMKKIDLKLLDEIFHRAEVASEISGHEAHVVELLEIYLACKAEHARAWGLYGVALRELGRHKDGLAALTRAYELAPENYKGYIAMQIAVLIKEYRSPGEALAWFEMGCTYLGAESGWPWVLRGENLVCLGEFDEAITCFETAQLGEHNHKDEALYNLGLAYRAKGDYRKASICFEEAIQITPNYELAINALNGMKKLDEALKLALAMRKIIHKVH
ncbi:tetratricopeptide repeat protein [Undibacterium sp. JH2W]|uniref:tetratricopeptide repeat protein n=1 Tax=Undibacterium sp. JH2W TaxID=3413037 RepID=UPI003BF23C40